MRRRFPYGKTPVFFLSQIPLVILRGTEGDRYFFCIWMSQVETVFQPSAFHKGGRGESLSRLLSFLYFKFARLWHFHQTYLHHRKLLEYRCDPAARLVPSIPRRRRHYRQLRYGGTRRRTGVAEADNTETVENTGVPSKYLYAPYELRYDTPIPNDNAVGGEAALTAPGLVGQAPPRLRFAGAGMDADMTPCGTGRKTAPEI